MSYEYKIPIGKMARWLIVMIVGIAIIALFTTYFLTPLGQYFLNTVIGQILLYWVPNIAFLVWVPYCFLKMVFIWLKANPAPVIVSPIKTFQQSSESANTKYCLNCGAIIPSVSTFCGKCGAKQVPPPP